MERKRNVSSDTHQHRIPLRMIENPMNTLCSSPQTHSKTQARVTLVRSNKLPDKLRILDPPSNGTQYEKMELIQLLSIIIDPSERSSIINEIVANNVVPASRSQLYSLLQQYKNKKQIIGEWRYKGRKRLLCDDDINKIATELNKESGKKEERQTEEDTVRPMVQKTKNRSEVYMQETFCSMPVVGILTLS